jgi:hypothetical protein
MIEENSTLKDSSIITRFEADLPRPASVRVDPKQIHAEPDRVV